MRREVTWYFSKPTATQCFLKSFFYLLFEVHEHLITLWLLFYYTVSRATCYPYWSCEHDHFLVEVSYTNNRISSSNSSSQKSSSSSSSSSSSFTSKIRRCKTNSSSVPHAMLFFALAYDEWKTFFDERPNHWELKSGEGESEGEGEGGSGIKVKTLTVRVEPGGSRYYPRSEPDPRIRFRFRLAK
jgi:hypothetical protein